MKKTDFIRLARANGYTHIDRGQDCVFAYNANGGEIQWYRDTVQTRIYKRKPHEQSH